MDEKTEFPEHLLIHSIFLDNTFYEANSEDLEKILQDLNSRLQPVGITVSADENTILKIEINEEKFQTATTRRAGRKKSETAKRYDEILAYRETHTAMETAEWLGLTRQTYYRKLKEHKDNRDDGSVVF